MAEIIRMPRMSDTMEEGVLVAWHKNIGDPVKAGDLLAEVETDKATMELESYQEGTLIHIGVDAGVTVPINAIIAILGDKGEDVSGILEEEKKKTAATEEKTEEKEEEKTEEKTEEKAEEKNEEKAEEVAPTSQPKPMPVHQATPRPTASSSNKRIKASPLAKKLAEENQLDLALIQGSGDQGRIIKRDIEAYLANKTAQPQTQPPPAKASPTAKTVVFAPVVGEEVYEDQPISQMRKTIARRLAESKFGAPHFYLTMEINMDRTIAARKKLNEMSPVKISFNDIIIKAAATALRMHPAVNAAWMGESLRFNKHVHVGMAVAVPEGLLVPVIKFADNKPLSHIAAETKELAGKAREKKLSLEEMTGNTFSISNLGMMDIDEFTAIINPPNACIMAVGRIAKMPRVNENNEIVVMNVMKITLSADHRVVDGAVGARFLQTFKSFLEEPTRMLV